MSCVEGDVHVDDYGTPFEIEFTECIDGVETPVDLTTYSSLRVWFLKPDGTTTVDQVGSLVNPPGTDGLVEYVSQPGDLDVAGDWEIQGKVVMPSGQWHTARGDFTVLPNII